MSVLGDLLTARPEQVDLESKGDPEAPYLDMDVGYPSSPYVYSAVTFSCSPWAGVVVGEEDGYLIVRVTYDTETQLISTVDLHVKPVWPATFRDQN